MMSRRKFSTQFDDRVGRGTEWITRRIDRRSALRTAMLTGAAAVGALALGELPAYATVTCPTVCGPSPLCRSGTCPYLGCPSGYSICKNPPISCNGYCEYSTGSWVHCQGYGNCGNGYTLCQDCKPTNSCSICICISGVVCSACCSAADVVEEQRKIQEQFAAMS